MSDIDTRPARQAPRLKQSSILIFIVLISVAALFGWLLQTNSVNVRIALEPMSFARYDDHDGNLPLCAAVQVTNLSGSRVKYFGYSGSPTIVHQQLVDGKWITQVTVHLGVSTDFFPNHISTLRSKESFTFFVGPISENATEIRVGVPFTTKWFPSASSDARKHWVFSPSVQIVKKNGYFFPEIKEGAKQEVLILSGKEASARFFLPTQPDPK